MNTRKILSLLALVVGEAVLIAAFVLLGSAMATNILVLNIVISSLIYALFFVDVLLPWIRLDKEQPTQVASLGVRWLLTGVYALAAILVMVCCNVVVQLSFISQLIIHLAIIVVLILGIVAVLTAAHKVSEKAVLESQMRIGLAEMKQLMSILKMQANTGTSVPQSVVVRINSLAEDLRYLSPANTTEAAQIESSFCKAANNLLLAISNYAANEQTVESNLKQMEYLYQTRKSVYSN